MYAIVRLRGMVNMTKEIEDSLEMLRLNRKMHCVILKEDSVVKGMLQKTKDRITWGEIDDDTLMSMIVKRGRKQGNVRLTKEEAEHAFKTLKDTGKMPETVKPVFRLTPPSKGFKNTIKQHYPKGELGYRGKEINALLKRMI